jgi:outer membrane protein insertion porin family
LLRSSCLCGLAFVAVSDVATIMSSARAQVPPPTAAPVPPEQTGAALPAPAPAAAPAPPAVASPPTLPPVEPTVPIPDAPPLADAATSPVVAPDSGVAAASNAPIRYVLEGIRVIGNRTSADIIAGFVPFKPGEHFDVDDPVIESVRWRLLGTGWFDDVKLSLARGSQRGWVVLLIEVKERNTLLIDRFVMGLTRSLTNTNSTEDTIRPYVGLGLVETNLLGWGVAVSGAAVVSAQQYGLELGYRDPMLLGGGFHLSSRLFHNYAREFFGRNPLVAQTCTGTVPVDMSMPDHEQGPEPCDPDVQAKRAVVIYHRTGFGLGTGHEISSHLRYTIDWLGEYIDVLNKPQAASTQRGNEIVPIDFHIDPGTSFVSSLRLGLIFDQRDHPALTTRGDYAEFYARIGSRVLGSNYEFARLEVNYRHWVPLPWSHVISFGLFAGTVFGDPPFFYDFYAADMSDLLPNRVLELNLDRRRTLNLLGTSIVEMDMEDLAAKLDVQYQLPLHRGGGFVRGVDAYLGAGVFLLCRRADLQVAISGYHGLASVPIDLTFDLGVQADTEIGLFKIGFSSLVGFSSLGRENP